MLSPTEWKNVVNFIIKEEGLPIDSFIKYVDNQYNEPVHSLQEMRLKRNMKRKGDYFEYLCKQLLLKSYENVWLLEEIPQDILLKLNLSKKDFGIDIIAQTKNSFYAVQCKYRQTDKKVTWKELSTFYALCSRSPIPFEKLIIMTTGISCLRKGKKTVSDQSVCYGTLKKLTKIDFIETVNSSKETGESPVEESTGELTPAELRRKRVLYFSNKS